MPRRNLACSGGAAWRAALDVVSRPRLATAFAAAALAASQGACDSCNARPPSATSTGAAGSPAGSTADVAGSAAPPASAAARRGGALDDLLRGTQTTVAVSSRVANATDHPEHLVDGKLDTAWNSRPGDLVGGWIAWQVPDDARVKRVELTVGFDATNKKGEDLFFTNHRIKRVRLSREGAVLGEFSLDPGRRGLQPLEIDAPGGKFRLEVLEVEGGTKKAWRELAVSELRVLGELPAGAKEARANFFPKVRVGRLAPALDEASTAWAKRHFGGLPELCEAAEAAVAPALEREAKEGLLPPQAAPYCRVGRDLARASEGELRRAVLVEIVTPEGVEVRAALQTVRSWLLTRPFFVLPLDSPFRGTVVASVRGALLRGNTFAVDYAEKELRIEPGAGDADGHDCGPDVSVWMQHRLFDCRINDDEASCRSRTMHEEKLEPGDEGPADLATWKKSGGKPRITDEGDVAF
ncbi:MAG TPA: hypothetical protein VFS43_36735 [Polyangiaceae bacterium]|nr:hypothetical protein [Polyangiaceae bacterium]